MRQNCPLFFTRPKPLNVVTRSNGNLSFYAQETHQNQLFLAKNLPQINYQQSISLLTTVGMLQRYLEYCGRENQLFYNLDVINYPYREHFEVIISTSCERSKTAVLYRWLNSALEEFKLQLTEPILARYKQNIIKTTRLELYDPKATLDTLAWYYYYFTTPITVEQEIELISAVRLDEVVTIYENLFESGKPTVMVAGVVTDGMKEDIRNLWE